MTEPSPTPPRKSLQKLVLRWAWVPVTVIVVAALLRLVDLDRVGRELATANLWDIAAMIGIWLVWLAVRPARMRMLLLATAPATPASYNDAYGAHALGNAINNLVPMRAGEFAMLWVLARRAQVPVAASLSAVVLDRLCDLAAALVTLGLAVLAMPNPPQAVVDGMEIIAAVLCVGMGVLALAVRLRPLALRIAAVLIPRRWHGALLHRLEALLTGLGVLGRPAVLAKAVLLSAAVWGLAALSFAAGIDAVQPGATLAMGAFTVGTIAMAFLVPAAPGGIGVFHAAVVFALSFFGVPAETALAFALITHALTFAIGLAVAGAWTLINGLDPREIARASKARGEDDGETRVG